MTLPHVAAETLSEGAKNMLLHIARVQPLPKPYPPEPDGRRHLAELLFADMIVSVAEGKFAPTPFGRAVAYIVSPSAGAAQDQGGEG